MELAKFSIVVASWTQNFYKPLTSLNVGFPIIASKREQEQKSFFIWQDTHNLMNSLNGHNCMCEGKKKLLNLQN